MNMIVAHNMMAMNAQRQFNIVGNKKAKSTEKLSSGYKINRAADDAAGLAISEKMRRQIRGLSQGTKNTMDGISLCQVADGALAEIDDMLHRITELSVKSANGTNTDEDREAIQQEISELLTEIDRIGTTTEFNGRKIFSDGVTRTIIPAEYVPSTASNLSIGGTPTGILANIYKIDANNSGITIGGKNYSWSEFKCGGNDLSQKPIAAGTYSLNFDGLNISMDVKANAEIDDIIGTIKGTQFEVKAGSSTSKAIASVSNVTGYQFSDDFQTFVDYKLITSGQDISIKSDDGVIDVSTNWKSFGQNYACFRSASDDTIIPAGTYNLGTGKVDWKTNTSFNYGAFSFELNLAEDVTFSELNNILNNSVITHKSSGLETNGIYYVDNGTHPCDFRIGGYFNSDDLFWKELGINPNSESRATAIWGLDSDDKAYFEVGGIKFTADRDYHTSGKFKFESSQGWYLETTMAVFANDYADLVKPGTAGFDIVYRPRAADYKGSKALTGIELANNGIITIPGDLTLENPKYPDYKGRIVKDEEVIIDRDAKELWIQSGSEAHVGMYLKIDNMDIDILGLRGLSVSTIEGANHALDAVKVALEKVSSNRSDIGAQQNRLEHTVKNNDNVVENTQAAESQIRDTDMAKEMVQNSMLEILSQAGISMMTQANQSNQGVLSLLQ